MLPCCLGFSDHLKQSSQWQTSPNQTSAFQTVKDNNLTTMPFWGVLQMPWPFSRGTLDEALIINEALDLANKSASPWRTTGFRGVRKKTGCEPPKSPWFPLNFPYNEAFRLLEILGLRLVKPRIGYLPPAMHFKTVLLLSTQTRLCYANLQILGLDTAFLSKNPLLKTSTSFSIEGW